MYSFVNLDSAGDWLAVFRLAVFLTNDFLPNDFLFGVEEEVQVVLLITNSNFYKNPDNGRILLPASSPKGVGFLRQTGLVSAQSILKLNPVFSQYSQTPKSQIRANPTSVKEAVAAFKSGQIAIDRLPQALFKQEVVVPVIEKDGMRYPLTATEKQGGVFYLVYSNQADAEKNHEGGRIPGVTYETHNLGEFIGLTKEGLVVDTKSENSMKFGKEDLEHLKGADDKRTS